MQTETAEQRRPDPWPFGPVRGPDVPADPSSDPAASADTDELVARLRARRSASGVAAAYAAAHGHPADPRPEQGARRWALTGTTAVVAVVAVLLLGVGVAVLSMRGDGVEPLTRLATASEATAGDATAGEVPAAEAKGGLPGGGPSSTSGTGGSAPVPDPAADAAGDGMLVHVVGQVAEPGLVTVPDGARVADALQAAGGTTGKADLTAVNLARTVVDGEQLYVPEPGEQVPGSTAPGAGPAQGTGGQAAAGGTVDINTADAVALQALPGVGPSIGQAIVEWRETNGPFASVDELEDVPGIGPATLAEIRDSARVGP